MIKEKIRNSVGSYNLYIGLKIDTKNQISAYQYTSEELKKEQEKELVQDIKAMKISAKNSIAEVIDEEIEGIKETSKELSLISGDSVEVTNVLKMLELSKDTLTKEEILYLADKYIDNILVFRSIEALAKSKNIDIAKKTFIIQTDELEKLKIKLMNTINENEISKIDIDKIEDILSTYTEIEYERDETSLLIKRR
ncbi:hypothetical protein BH721_04465 [Clostridium baratii]|uniref:hypothetical protein n=1 Tax=Clostridium baratii TaxID=1561 RepID=UPI0009A2EDBC|nr:hypothetical protein [Clostridium baratii]OPF52514.1 hypothetical protein A1M12_10670 [Clostridium baratii]OPF55962.1 hypothetical protein BH721_04465 [Clostridium baratii]OPF58444.1 hypothetical protein BH724_06115 [Clostridium baratii]OPF59656.1 hypothetical protein BH725_03460 [Clostridium baratii]